MTCARACGRYRSVGVASVPALRGGPVVAYDPVDLDKQVKKFLAIAERNIDTLEALGEPLAKRIKAEVDANSLDAEATSIVYDRLVKAGLNLVKATDELSRLRSFLSGGPDTRPDLSSMGEIELRGVLLMGIKALGLTFDDLKKLLTEER